MEDPFSLSNSLSKGSVYESFSLLKATLGDAQSWLTDPESQVSISNEAIGQGDDILSTYKVVSDAIRGGMGSVWRVHHLSWDTDLAMKRPQPRFFAQGSERRKEEFIAECEHWIDLGLHPNIVSCYYVREIGGVPTIFSEWMDGGSLKDAIQNGRLYEGTEAEVRSRLLDIALQTARGLQYAHEKGLIHQDVKPGNILLTKDWDAKVADFGLAKAQSQLTDGEKPVSSGYTLAYCPQEQATGATPEKWMDVYAWALTVAEMYLGERPWATGAEAQKRCEKLFQACRTPLAPAMEELLSGCLTARIAEFGAVEAVLKDLYRELCGHAYPHPEADAAIETADALSNQGISYLEIGLAARGIPCVEQANAADPHHAEAMFNHALIDWRKGMRTGDEVYLQLLRHHPFFTRTEAGRQALRSLLQEAGKSAFDAPLAEGLPGRQFASAPEDRYSAHLRLWHGKVYLVRSIADVDPWRWSLLVFDAQTGAQLSCEEIAPFHDCQDRKVRQFALNADCSQLMLYLSDGTLLLYDLASHSIAAQHSLPMLKYGESAFHLYTVGTGGRFFRCTVSHLPRHNNGPFSNSSRMTFVPPTEEIYDLKTGTHLERAYSDWDLIRAGADGTLPAYSEPYRFSLSDERQAVGIREDETGRRLYCSEDGSAIMPVPPVLDALLYRLWRNEHDGRDCRVLRITGDGRIWIRNGPKLTEFDLITGKSLHSFPLSGMDTVSIDEDGLGVLLLRGDSWYFRNLEPIRPEDRAAWLFSAPENYGQYLERKQRIEDLRAAFDRAEAQGSTADMCAAYDEAEGCRGFFGTAAQRDMADRLRRSCRQKDSELFLDVQKAVRAGDEQGKSLLAPFGEWRDIPDELIRHSRKGWISDVIVSPDARRALILSGENGGPSSDKGGLYLADLPTDKLYLLKEYDRRVDAGCGFCADRMHIVYDTNEIRGPRLQYADISDGSQPARDLGEWEAAEERDQRCHRKDHFIGACFSKKPLPGTGDGVSMIWPYGIFTFQTEADFDAFYARPGKRMQILAADEPNGLIAYQAVSNDEHQTETTELRVWSVDERRDLLQVSDWNPRRGIVRFAQADGGALRMLAARLGLSDQDAQVYPIEIYQLRCAYAPEPTLRRRCGLPPEWPVITLPECDWEDDRFGVGFQGETALRDRGARLVNARSAETLKEAYFIFCDLIRRFPKSRFMEVYHSKRAIAVSGLEETVAASRKAGDAKGLEGRLDLFQARLRVYPHEEETARLRDKTAEALADVLSGRDDAQSMGRALALYAELAERHPDETIYRKRAASVQKQLDRRQKGPDAKASAASFPAQPQANDRSMSACPEAQSRGLLGKLKGLFSGKKG